MNVTESARACIALGATLVFVTAPPNAIAGIEGANAMGIEGANVLGIEGANVLGIEGSNVLGIEGANVLGHESARILSGPVDFIDIEIGSFVSMGQTVAASREMLSDLRVGDLVTVEGSVMGPGWLYADRVSVSSERYVPGATEVFVTGMPTSVNRFTGQVEMGDLTVDYTASLAGGNLRPGTVWTFRGIQPNNRGVLVAGEAASR